MRELTQELSVSAQNVSVMVDGLESQGLVARDQNPTDRRVVVVKLTATGQARVDADMATHQAAVSSLFDCLTERQRAEFAVALDRLCNELELRLRPVR
jgi:DNA-binding MarR family transcriptional regulator